MAHHEILRGNMPPVPPWFLRLCRGFGKDRRDRVFGRDCGDRGFSGVYRDRYFVGGHEEGEFET